MLVLPFACATTYGSGKRLAKDVINVGVFKHPKAGWTLDVTRERIDKWLKAFSQMIAQGVPVPLVKDHKVSTDSTLGYALNAHRVGDRLHMVFEVPDEETAKQLKKVNNVSIFLEKEFKDGKGRGYGEAITHVALTPEPVVPGQDGFVSIAASSGQEQQVDVLEATERSSPMNKELLKKFRSLVKAGEDVSDEDVLAALDKFVEGELLTKAELKKEIAALKEKMAESEKPETSSEDLEDRAADVSDAVDEMVKDKQITPVVAASLKAELCGTSDARNSYMLSRSSAPNDQGIRPVRARALLAIIRQIEPVKTGEQTAGQALSRTVPGKEVKPDDLDKLSTRLASISDDAAGGSVVM